MLRLYPPRDYGLTDLARPVTPSLNGIKPESTTVATLVASDTIDSFEASIADVDIDLGDF